jgi:hypothetical protein
MSSFLHSGTVSSPPKRNIGVVTEGFEMSSEHPELDELQAAYKAAVESWISAIRNEEALASANHSMAEIDRWEQAHLEEDEMRNAVKAAKAEYEDALRQKFFGF